MGLIMRNGVAYAGSNSIELTQAEYNALVSAGQVQPDTFYCIVDADNVLPASDITYDNTDSGLSANRVQSAIDEVVTDISHLDARMHMKNVYFKAGTPMNLPTLMDSSYGMYIIFGFFQGIGAVLLGVEIGGSSLRAVRNIRENSNFSSEYYSFSYSTTNGLTVTSTLSSMSAVTAIYS